MNVEIKCMDGYALFSRDLDALEKALQKDAVLEIARAGGDVVVEEIKNLIQTKAKGHSKRAVKLADNVSYDRYEGIVRDSRGVTIGWKRTHIADGGTRTEHEGWGGRVKRVRKVNTIADVGGILEYSRTRELRHMEEGFNKSSVEAADVMQAAFDKLMEKALGK